MPEIVGDLTAKIAPAIKIATNIKREIYAFDKTLTLYAMTPAGETELVSYDEDWAMMRVKDTRDFPEFPFEFEIFDEWGFLTDEIKRTAATATVGDQRYKIKPPQSTDANLGLWKFRAQAI